MSAQSLATDRYSKSAGEDTSPSVREPQVLRAITNVEKEHALHDSLLEELERRLNPILRPTPPQADGAKNEPKEVTVELASTILSSASMAGRHNQWLRSIIDRLEL